MPPVLAAAVANEAIEQEVKGIASPRMMCSIGDGLMLREDEPLWRWWDTRYGSAVPTSPCEHDHVPIVH